MKTKTLVLHAVAAFLFMAASIALAWQSSSIDKDHFFAAFMVGVVSFGCMICGIAFAASVVSKGIDGEL